MILLGQIATRLKAKRLSSPRRETWSTSPSSLFIWLVWWGDGPSCRLSMHGYPHNLAHLRDP